MTAQPEKTHVVKELAHKHPLIACRFDAGGRYVFASSEDNTVQRRDLETGKATPLTGHESWLFALAAQPGGDAIITGGGDGQLIWWAGSAGKPELVRRVQRIVAGSAPSRSALTARLSPHAATTG